VLLPLRIKTEKDRRPLLLRERLQSLLVDGARNPQESEETDLETRIGPLAAVEPRATCPKRRLFVRLTISAFLDTRQVAAVKTEVDENVSLKSTIERNHAGRAL
jgi:hypothetical protein